MSSIPVESLTPSGYLGVPAGEAGFVILAHLNCQHGWKFAIVPCELGVQVTATRDANFVRVEGPSVSAIALTIAELCGCRR